MEKVIAKIKKLLALSKSSNEHEAALAMERAQALLAEHNLDMSQLDASESQKETKVGHGSTGKSTMSRPWFRMLAAAVGELYFCKYFYTTNKIGTRKYDTHYYVGQQANVAVASLMFVYLAKTVNRLAKEDPVGRHDPAFVNSFRLACVRRLTVRIRERVQKTSAGPTMTEDGASNLPAISRNLPALLSMYEQNRKANEKYIEEEIGVIKKTPSRQRSGSQLGEQRGREAADDISLDAQITGGPDKGQLQIRDLSPEAALQELERSAKRSVSSSVLIRDHLLVVEWNKGSFTYKWGKNYVQRDNALNVLQSM